MANDTEKKKSASQQPTFSPGQKRRALGLMTPDRGPALELEEVDALRRAHRAKVR